jgi:kynurenine formamidase
MPTSTIPLDSTRVPYLNSTLTEEPRRFLDLYRTRKDDHSTPTSPQPHTLIVFVHGGAWRTNSPEEFRPQVDLLFAHAPDPSALTVAVPGYRLTVEPEWLKHPVHVDDVGAALSLLATRPSGMPPPDQTILVGHSCGATIVAQLTLEDRIPPALRTIGSVGIEGIYDLPRLLRDFPDYASFVNPVFGSDLKGQAKASPTHMAPAYPRNGADRPRWLLFSSSEDELVNQAQSADFANALTGAGWEARFDPEVIKGQHDPLLGLDAWAKATWSILHR